MYKQDWVSVKVKPNIPDFYLVAVDTDSGTETHILEFDGRNWIHEGEPTFCKGYMFRPYAWAARPQAPEFSDFADDD